MIAPAVDIPEGRALVVQLEPGTPAWQKRVIMTCILGYSNLGVKSVADLACVSMDTVQVLSGVARNGKEARP